MADEILRHAVTRGARIPPLPSRRDRDVPRPGDAAARSRTPPSVQPPSDASELVVPLDRLSATPLYRQIYRAIRDAVVMGRLRPGARLPSSRELAERLGVSRNTVLAAFVQLEADQITVGRVGAGTRIDPALRGRIPRSPHVRAHGQVRLSRRTQAAMTRIKPMPRGTGTLFTPTMPDLELFPWRTWRTLLCRHTPGRQASTARSVDPAGHGPLREAIAAYLGAARGVSASADQIIVVHGTQQGLDLASRVLLDPGDLAGIEDPGYPGAAGAFSAAHAQLFPVPVGPHGPSLEVLRAAAEPIRVMYVSPSHQFPLGYCLPFEDRLALLEWAREVGTWLIEDDYDSEFRYGGPPVTALAGLDSAARVWYLGTFSKTLSPTLRLGYAVVPDELIDAALAVRQDMDLFPAVLEQAALADFLNEGHYARHLKRMRSRYRSRREALIRAFEREMDGLATLSGDDTGLRMVAWLPRGTDDSLVSRLALEAGIDAPPVSELCLGRSDVGPGVILSFGATPDDGIQRGVRQLRRVLEQTLP